MDSLTEDLLQRVAEIRPVIEAHAQAGEDERRLPDPVYDALLSKGLFTILTPKALGGMEGPPTTAYAVWEAVARIDSATAWNLAQASAGMLMSAGLSSAGRAKLFTPGAQPIFAGAGFPPAVGKRVEGGFRVSGRLPFVSGCHRADWLFFPFLNIEGDKPESRPDNGGPVVRMAFFPRKAAEIIDTWRTMGMRGTGSADVVLADAYVPEDLTTGGEPDPNSPFAGALYRLGHWPVIHGEAVVSLGIAAAAIDKLLALAERTPAMSSAPLRDRELVQLNLGRARAMTDAARAYLYGSAGDAYAEVSAGGTLDGDDKVALQLSACNAAEASAKAVDLVFEAAGTASIRAEPGLERHFRDVHVATQHATKSTSRYVSVGRILLGLPSDTPLLR